MNEDDDMTEEEKAEEAAERSEMERQRLEHMATNERRLLAAAKRLQTLIDVNGPHAIVALEIAKIAHLSAEWTHLNMIRH